MRQGRVGTIAVTAMMLLGAFTGCSSESSSASAEMTSAPRPTSQPGTSAPIPDDDPAGSGTVDEDAIPDPGDITRQFEEFADDLGIAGDCLDLGIAYARLPFIAFSSNDPGPELQEVIDELAEKLPADLQDELKTVGDAYAKIAEEGLVDSSISDSKFVEANQAISDWLATRCSD